MGGSLSSPLFGSRSSSRCAAPGSTLVYGAGARGADPPEQLRVAHLVDSLDEDVRAYVLADPSGVFAAAATALPALGFERCVDYPDLPDHIYFEGYFHALPQGTPLHRAAVNPRTGTVMESKPAAPLRLRALVEAVRRGNAEVLAVVAAASPVLQRLHDTGAFFADVAVQVHCGAGVGGDHLGWHRDAPNSVLHMGLSLAGHRTLHAVTSRKRKPPTAKSARYPAEGAVQHRQIPGSVYVSSPYAFWHAVEYPALPWEDRIIAVQLRLAVSHLPHPAEEDGADSSGAPSGAPSDNTPGVHYGDLVDACALDQVGLMGAVADALMARPLVLPSLADVQAVEAELSQSPPPPPQPIQPPA